MTYEAQWQIDIRHILFIIRYMQANIRLSDWPY